MRTGKDIVTVHSDVGQYPRPNLSTEGFRRPTPEERAEILRTPDARRACSLRVMHVASGRMLRLLVYGRTAAEMQRVPCEEIMSIQRRRGLGPPEYQSSPFWIEDAKPPPRPDDWKRQYLESRRES